MVFSVQDIVFPGISLQAFLLWKSVRKIFFSEITHKPLKSQIVGSQNQTNICSVDRFWFRIISKAFWNNRGQNSLGERGGIRFYFPLPGESVRTDVRWRHNQNLSDGGFINFITHGAPLGALRAWGLGYNNILTHYYSFKIFPRFWLAKSTRIIDHYQLLIT